MLRMAVAVDSAVATSAKVVMTSHCVVRRSRPIVSVRKAECSATPVTAAGCSACIMSARTPPTSVVRDPCTTHDGPSGTTRQSGSPVAMRAIQGGVPSESPESRRRNARATSGAGEDGTSGTGAGDAAATSEVGTPPA